MSKTVIQVEHLSKAYRIGVAEKKSDTIAGALWNAVQTPFRNFKNLRNLRSLEREEDSVFWALKDINFEVKQGEVLGIIGHNGAGKSTLLKILSRITEPTEGRVTIQGRVSSLLEVGTGFHPDLTGRENIYMNGTILGMRKREIDAKLDEIIAFSGISKYIDTPVKRYSSGMTVRLAFSVAAHLEPEILIIDEVLAVGDAEFQNKCLGKMDEVAKAGRTVLFVSHNMGAVSLLCSRGLLLQKGCLKFDGDQKLAIEKYLTKKMIVSPELKSNGLVLEEYSIEYSGSSIKTGMSITVKGQIVGDCHDNVPYIILLVNSTSNEKLILISSRLERIQIPSFSNSLTFSIVIHNLNLMPNRYRLDLMLLNLQGHKIAEWLNYTEIDVVENEKLAGLSLPDGRNRGVVYCHTDWSIVPN